MHRQPLAVARRAEGEEVTCTDRPAAMRFFKPRGLRPK